MKPILIDANLAWRLRSERGLKLNPYGNYATSRLKEIAIKQHKLFEELDALDNELESLSKNETQISEEIKNSN